MEAKKNRIRLTTPRRDPLFTILCAYGFSGVNAIVTLLLLRGSPIHSDFWESFLFGGALLLLMVPVTLWDNRPGTRDFGAAVMTLLLYAAVCGGCAYVLSPRMLLLCCAEIGIYFAVGYLIKKFRRRRRR